MPKMTDCLPRAFVFIITVSAFVTNFLISFLPVAIIPSGNNLELYILFCCSTLLSAACIQLLQQQSMSFHLFMLPLPLLNRLFSISPATIFFSSFFFCCFHLFSTAYFQPLQQQSLSLHSILLLSLLPLDI